MQGSDAPFLHVIHKHVEGRLIKLNDVHARVHQFLGLLIENVRKRHGHVRSAGIVGVGDGVADGHGSRQGEFEPLPCLGAGEADFLQMHRPGALHGRRDCGHFHGVAVVADTHGGLELPVDTLDVL